MVEGSGLEQMSPELENSVFSEIHTIHGFETSYNTEVETRKRGM